MKKRIVLGLCFALIFSLVSISGFVSAENGMDNISVTYIQDAQSVGYSTSYKLSVSRGEDTYTKVATFSLDSDCDVYTRLDIKQSVGINNVEVLLKSLDENLSNVEIYKVSANNTVDNNFSLSRGSYQLTFMVSGIAIDTIDISFSIDAIKRDKPLAKTGTMGTSGVFSTTNLWYGNNNLEYDINVGQKSKVTFNYTWNPIYCSTSVRPTENNLDSVDITIIDYTGKAIKTVRLNSDTKTHIDSITASSGVYKVFVEGGLITSGSFDLSVSSKVIAQEAEEVSNDTHTSKSDETAKFKATLAKSTVSKFKHGSIKITGKGVHKATVVVTVLKKHYKAKVSGKGKWVIKLPKKVAKKIKKGTKIKCYQKKSGYRNSKTVTIKAR